MTERQPCSRVALMPLTGTACVSMARDCACGALMRPNWTRPAPRLRGQTGLADASQEIASPTGSRIPWWNAQAPDAINITGYWLRAPSAGATLAPKWCARAWLFLMVPTALKKPWPRRINPAFGQALLSRPATGGTISEIRKHLKGFWIGYSGDKPPVQKKIPTNTKS